MAVSFDEVPQNALVPFSYIEISPQRAGTGALEFRSLLIGQRLAAGSAAAEVPIQVGSAVQARTLFGAGSMLALMCEAFRRQNENGQLWAVPLDDAAGSAQGTTTVTVTGAATAAGTIALYIAGRRVAVPISGATAVNAVATAIATAVQAAGGGTNGVLPVVATVTSAVVTLTNRNGGLSSDIDVRDSFQADEALPAGVAVTYATTAGATDPDIDDALDAVVDERFDVIGHPYGAAASMAALESALRTRWGPTLQLDGWAVTAFRGTAGAATTYGNARNSQFSCVQGISTAPTSIPGWSGAMAGRVRTVGGQRSRASVHRPPARRRPPGAGDGTLLPCRARNAAL